MEERQNIHKPFSKLTESLGFVYLHSLDVLKVPGKTANHLPVWVYFTLFDDPAFGARNDVFRPSRYCPRLEDKTGGKKSARGCEFARDHITREDV